MPTCHMPDEGGRARRVQTAQDIRRLQPTFLLGTASLFRPLGHRALQGSGLRICVCQIHGCTSNRTIVGYSIMSSRHASSPSNQTQRRCRSDR